MRWRRGTVIAAGRVWTGAVELEVRLDDGGRCVAIAYVDLVGRPEPGDVVLLNVGALDLDLGTGGFALVVAVPDRLPPDTTAPGHLIKARYTPLQATVLGADEPASPHHAALRDATSIDAMPVVVADLHSALPAVIAGVRLHAASARIAYLMTDGGALPVALSRTVAGLRDAGWIVGCISTGQSFGGDLEAVSVHSGLLAARHVLRADVVVVTQGPGNLGTDTRWGFSGVAAGEAVNAAAVLGGRAVAALRVSQAEPRDRHRGISHHSLTAYGSVALTPADVVIPLLPGDFGAEIRAAAQQLGERHRLVDVGIGGLDAALRGCPVPLSTMGRGLDDDPAAFLASAAAGRHAAGLLAAT
ncbi:MAG: DUF3866 family protein [Mycobacteriales bacterium]|nr:MAG: DUF3866 domain-containing protein [Pseudonocardiales bacterium]